MTDPELAAQSFVAGPDRLERQLTDVLQQAKHDGASDRRRDAATEAIHLLLLSHGLGAGVLVGRRRPGAAIEILRARLGRLCAHPVPSLETAAGRSG
ncbi:hypothetical protein [Streptomyces sp. NPDC050704]|uniref:hypothetical protein n=1 Tax=Streptomyces sp. NPDC050704 TaxID=3157219 RepID=UPI0034340408